MTKHKIVISRKNCHNVALPLCSFDTTIALMAERGGLSSKINNVVFKFPTQNVFMSYKDVIIFYHRTT